jgi:hypothetical protein
MKTTGFVGIKYLHRLHLNKFSNKIHRNGNTIKSGSHDIAGKLLKVTDTNNPTLMRNYDISVLIRQCLPPSFRGM